MLKLNSVTNKQNIKEPIIQISRENFIKKCNAEINFKYGIKLEFVINNIEYIECEERYFSNIWVFNSNNIFFITTNNKFYLLLIKPLYH
jgi:hypothetical protein